MFQVDAVKDNEIKRKKAKEIFQFCAVIEQKKLKQSLKSWRYNTKQE